MSIHHSRLNTAVAILARYNGSEPFASFLKKYFAEHKKMGSRDRKLTAHLCYCYFRAGKLFTASPDPDILLATLFLCSRQPHELLTALRPEWAASLNLPTEAKLAMVMPGAGADQLFPWKEELSQGIDPVPLVASLTEQPDLFLRLRPGSEAVVTRKLQAANIPFTPINKQTLALPNGSRVDVLIRLNQEAVVQDLSSQEVAVLLKTLPKGTIRTVWDCCAASGGKSILLWDTLGPVQLTVSDSRASILANLRKRFAAAGIACMHVFEADLSEAAALPGELYDLVIADVPCTGSGTWGRTPEQLYYFDPARISRYASLQKKIAANVINRVKKGGWLLYITCSVFRKENEEVVTFLQKEQRLDVVQMEWIKGYDRKADTLFATLLRKPTA